MITFVGYILYVMYFTVNCYFKTNEKTFLRHFKKLFCVGLYEGRPYADSPEKLSFSQPNVGRYVICIRSITLKICYVAKFD